MTTDPITREDLEMAAKAAGLDSRSWKPRQLTPFCAPNANRKRLRLASRAHIALQVTTYTPAASLPERTAATTK